MEIWKDIVSFEGLYQASNLGNIKSCKKIDSIGRHKKEKILKKNIGKDGYFVVGLCKNGKVTTRSIHRLIIETFLGKSELQVNHKNRNRNDNNIENLEYVSCRDNIMHKYINRENHLSGAYRDNRCKNKWSSAISIGNKKHYLGKFNSQEEAHLAYLKACENFNIINKYITYNV